MVVFKLIAWLLKTGFWFIKGVFRMIGLILTIFIAILGG